MNKPVVIIPCSNKKSTDSKNKAYNIYQGDMLSGIRALGMDIVLSSVELFFLSGKYGLIHASTIIDNYKQRVPKDKSGQLLYINTHKKEASKLLTAYANKETKCYILLSKDYSNAFKAMDISCLRKFKTVYHSQNAQGSGDHKARFVKIIKNAITPNKIKETIIRSGCCNETEFLGYRAAGEAIGTSLHYIDKSPALMQYTIDSIKAGNPTFVDNGLITAVTKGHQLNSNDVFASYSRLINGWKGNKKSLSIVVPDSPTDEDQALSTIIKHLKQIKAFSKICNVIIPIHKPNKRSTREQVERIQRLLGQTKVTIGIPCRTKGNADWRMDIADIEPILEFKAKDPKTNAPAKDTWVKRVHFFALSEVSGKAYLDRADLAQRYNLTYQLDASRTTALFGNEQTSKRRGSQVSRAVKDQLTNKKPAKELVRYQHHDLHREWETEALVEAINNLSSKDKAVLVNSLTNHQFTHITIDASETDEHIEEVFNNIFFAYPAQFIGELIELIETSFILNKHKPSFSQVREKSITRIFTKGNSRTGTPVQQALIFDQKPSNKPKGSETEIKLFNEMHEHAQVYGSWISKSFINYLQHKEKTKNIDKNTLAA